METPERWEHANPVRVLFGPGRIAELTSLARGRSLLVTTRGASLRGQTARVMEIVGHSTLVFDGVTPNPEIDAIEATIARFGGERIDTVIALGGGSSLDFAKALTAALGRPSFSLREALAKGMPPPSRELPRLIAVPTTAGTGSEVTPFATVWDGPAKKKHSLAAPELHPEIALVDPELTISLPWDATLAPGLDALSQCFESIWNRNATPVTIALAERGLSLVPDALRALKKDREDYEARIRMSEAALLSGLAISRTRTALAHSMSYPITAHFGVPHGLACGFSVPALLLVNAEADDGRLADLARRAGAADVPSLARSLIALFRELGVPEAFRGLVTDFARLDALAPEMLAPGRADNNLRPADEGTVREVLRRSREWLLTDGGEIG